jgi:hypothetical protein
MPTQHHTKQEKKTRQRARPKVPHAAQLKNIEKLKMVTVGDPATAVVKAASCPLSLPQRRQYLHCKHAINIDQ